MPVPESAPDAPARAKVDAVANGYRIRLASATVRGYNMRLTVPDLATLTIVLEHHFKGHAFDANCPQCVKQAKAAPSPANKLKLPRQRALVPVRPWSRHNMNLLRQTRRDYYANVLKPKLAAKRAQPLLMHRHQLVIRL